MAGIQMFMTNSMIPISKKRRNKNQDSKYVNVNDVVATRASTASKHGSHEHFTTVNNRIFETIVTLLVGLPIEHL